MTDAVANDLFAAFGPGKRGLAAALARLETGLYEPDAAELLDRAFAEPRGVSLGLTGPPGVGKSTLIDALIRGWRAKGRSIGVIAVDPSSARSGGALLGDRTRFTTDPSDVGVFVRSMAARDRLGGIAEITFPAMVLMRAVYDLVIIETVGVGQSETAVHEIADITAFCAQPGSGDALQYMKAGVMEIPDFVIVTKADMGIPAQRTAQDLAGALSLDGTKGAVPVILCSAADGQGVDATLQEICTQSDKISPNLADIRNAQVIRWGRRQIGVRFGTFGLSRLPDDWAAPPGDSPFCRISGRIKSLTDAMTEAFQ